MMGTHGSLNFHFVNTYTTSPTTKGLIPIINDNDEITDDIYDEQKTPKTAMIPA